MQKPSSPLTFPTAETCPPPLFSPVFGRLNPETLGRWILEDHLDVRLQLQLHKWIWGPEKRGV